MKLINFLAISFVCIMVSGVSNAMQKIALRIPTEHKTVDENDSLLKSVQVKKINKVLFCQLPKDKQNSLSALALEVGEYKKVPALMRNKCLSFQKSRKTLAKTIC